MKSYYEEPKEVIDGVVFPFYCHAQETSKSGVITNPHIHDYIEILYCLGGRAEIFLNWEKYDFVKGDMIIINSKEVHSVHREENQEPLKYIVIKFEPDILYTSFKSIFEAKYVLPFTMSNSNHQKLFTYDEIKDTFIPELLNETATEFFQKKYGYELAIRAHICRIFLWILRYWNEKGLALNINDALNESNIGRLQIVFDYVAENYMNDISVASAAELCNMSYSYFSRFFKSVLRKNFCEYLNYVRVTEAEKLLISSDLNITEIAQEVGFSTSSYFIQKFKQYKNISPLQYKMKFCS